MKKYDAQELHPEDSNNMNYWAVRWEVSPSQLVAAIIETGSVSTRQIKTYLKRDGWLWKPAIFLKKLFNTGIRMIS